MSEERRKCPDDGTCHHSCTERYGACWRVFNASPLSASGWDHWPADVREEERRKLIGHTGDCHNCGMREGVQMYVHPNPPVRADPALPPRIHLCERCVETFGDRYGAYERVTTAGTEDTSMVPRDPLLLRAAERTDERMTLIMEEGVDTEEVHADRAALIFAGTDLPAREVFRLLANMVKHAKEDILREDTNPSTEMRGVALSAFFLGFFVREELQGASVQSWQDAVGRRAALSQAKFERGEELDQEDVIAMALTDLSRYEVMVRIREGGQ